MAQYDVHQGQPGLGYLLNIQTDMLENMPTRVVIPLMPTETGTAIKRLNPLFEIAGEDYMLATQFMFTIASSELSESVCNLADQHISITSALDMLISGY